MLAAIYDGLIGIFTFCYHIIISIKIDEIRKKFKFWDGTKPQKLEIFVFVFVFSLFKC